MQLSPFKSMLGITESQDLWETIPHTQLLDIIARPDVLLSGYSVGENAYGEFLFFSIHLPNHREYITVYGLGENWNSEKWLTATWKFYESYTSVWELEHYPLETISAKALLAKIETRIADITKQGAYLPHVPSQRATYYSMLAEFSDEDSAIMEIDDLMNLLGEMD